MSCSDQYIDALATKECAIAAGEVLLLCANALGLIS
jgi:hypothetical protein